MKTGAILVLMALTCSVEAQDPRPFVQLSAPSSVGVEPGVASDGDLTAAYWNSAIGETILVSISNGLGAHWTPAVRLDSDSSGANKAPETWGIAVHGSRIYVAWRDERFGNLNDEIFFTRSINSGLTWTPEVVIDKGTSVGVGGVRDWRMVVEPGATGDHVYFLLAVDPTTGGVEALFLTASHNGGVSFAPAVSPSSQAVGSVDVDDIDLAANGTNVYAVWRDDRFPPNDEVFFQRSTNGGSSWLPSDVVLSNPADARDADDEVEIAVEGSVVAVAMQEDGAANVEEVRVRVSSNTGGSWGVSQKVGNYVTDVDDVDMTPGAFAILPGGRIIVAWSDDRAGAVDVNEVYVASSSNAGLTWSPDMRVSLNTGGAPKLASQGSRAALTWAEGGGVDDVGATFSTTGGTTWHPTFLLPKPSGQDIDDPFLAYNDTYKNFIYVWLAGSFFNEVYAGGFRLGNVRVR